jgi:hypothetical protein
VSSNAPFSNFFLNIISFNLVFCLVDLFYQPYYEPGYHQLACFCNFYHPLSPLAVRQINFGQIDSLDNKAKVEGVFECKKTRRNFESLFK